MGSDDIIKDFYYNEDGSEEDVINDWTQGGVMYDNYNTTVGLNHNRTKGLWYQSLLRNAKASFDLTVIQRYDATENSNTNNIRVFIKLNDGNYYSVGIQGKFKTGQSHHYLGYSKSSTRPTTTYETMTLYELGVAFGSWNAIALRFKSNGYVDLVKKFETSTLANMRTAHPTKKSMHDLDGVVVVENIFEWGGAKIEEIGITNTYTDHDDSVDLRFYGIYIDADEAVPEGGSAILDNVISFNTTTNIGGGAGATFIMGYDRNSASMTVDMSGNSMDFASATHSITRTSGSWITEGFKIGQLVEVRGTTSNDTEGGHYVVDFVSALELSFTSAAGIISGLDDTGIIEVDIFPSLKTYKENLGKSVTIQDTTYGNYMFKGEIKSMRIDSQTVTYRVEEGIRKLTKQFANYNPVLYFSEILKTEDSVVYDEFAGWEINDYSGKLLVTKDIDLYKTTIHPISVTPYLADPQEATGWTQQTPDTEGGSIEYLYFDNRLIFQNEAWVPPIPTHTNDVYGIHYLNESGGGSTDDTPGMEFLFKIWYKAGTNFNTLTLKSVIRFTSLKSTKVEGTAVEYFPRMWIYNTTFGWKEINNWNNADYSSVNKEQDEEWYTSEIEAADSTSGKSPIFTDDIVITDELVYDLSAYFENTSEVNDSGFRSSEIRIRLKGASVSESVIGVPDKDPKMEVHYMHLEFEDTGSTKISQGQELNVGLISSNTGTKLNMDDTPSWTIVDFPPADGVTVGDDYYISDNVETILPAVFSNANTDFTVTTDFGESYIQYGEIEDLTYTPVYDYLQKVSSQFNWVFWYKPTTTTNVILLADQFTDTGVTLTSSDIVNYNDDAFAVSVDIHNIRTKIVVVGDEGITGVADDGVEYNAEVAFTLGDEEVVYTDSELYSQDGVDIYVTSKQNINASKSISVEVTLDYDDPLQNYSSIAVGKTIAIEIPEYSSAIDGNLFIEGMTYMSSDDMGWQQFVTLHLMKRVV